MNDKLYPKSQFDADIETLRKMDLSDDIRAEKGTALAYIYYNQNDEKMVDHLAIADYRENILQKE